MKNLGAPFVASGASHASGFVPDPGASAGTTKFLREDATFVNPLASPAQIDAHYGAVTADADGATITFNLDTSDKHSVTLGGNRTLALSGGHDGQIFMLILKQDGTGSRTVTWFGNLRWAGGSAPTLTTTAGKEDYFTFIRRSSSDFVGFVTGQNA